MGGQGAYDGVLSSLRRVYRPGVVIEVSIGLALATKILAPQSTRTVVMRKVAVGTAVVAAVLVVGGVVAIIDGAPRAGRGRFAEFAALYRKYMPFMPTHVVDGDVPGH